MVDLGGGLSANAETYEGAILGPVMHLNLGDTMIVRFINKLDHPTSMHTGSNCRTPPTALRCGRGAPSIPGGTSGPGGRTFHYKFKVPTSRVVLASAPLPLHQPGLQGQPVMALYNHGRPVFLQRSPFQMVNTCSVSSFQSLDRVGF
jgi:FtsP/CotA-like multicopper oxidase with cupredoxin domain